MRDRFSWSVAGVAVFAAALIAGSVEVQAIRDRRYPPRPIEQDSLYVQSGPALRRLTVAYNALAADVYWIRTIQYYGDAKRRLNRLKGVPEPPPALAAGTSNEYSMLYPLLDLTTSLDPRFNIAYRFGAVFLAEAYPGGLGRPDLAIALLEKGLRERPDKWEYMEDIGFVHYWYVHDYRGAAAWFKKAGDVPGAPWWLKSLAASTLIQGGDRQSSRLMWEAIRQSSEVDWLRQDAERRLMQLQALDQLDSLQRDVDEAARRTGERVEDWAPVIRARQWPGVPVDPSGTPYMVSAGRVSLSPESRLFPLPEEPHRLEGAPPS